MYPDYRVPADLLEPPPASRPDPSAVSIDGSSYAIVTHWRIVLADLQLHHDLDLFDPAVRARPWPGIRTAIYSLLDQDTRLRRALTRR